MYTLKQRNSKMKKERTNLLRYMSMSSFGEISTGTGALNMEQKSLALTVSITELIMTGKQIWTQSRDGERVAQVCL